ncbi:Hypothetical protein PHPALM_10752, partial [Phytophthora palmivora]
GFHRESDEDATKIKLEPGIEASAEGVSPQTLLSEAGYTHHQSTGRSSDDVKEEGSAMDLEEKPHPPPQAPSGAPADRDANHGPLDEDPSAKADRTSSTTTPPASRVAAKKKKPKTMRKKLKAPDSDAEDRGDVHTWTDDELELAFHRKELASFLTTDPVMKVIRPKVIGDLHGPTWTPTESSNKLDAVKVLMRTLKEAGIVSGAFDANTLFDLDLTLIHKSTMALYQKLVPLVGTVTPEEAPRHTSFRNPEYQTGSSQYASATSEAGSDSATDLQRMTLGPTGATMLRERHSNEKSLRPNDTTPVTMPSKPAHSSDRMQTFFNAAMERFLKEERATGSAPVLERTEAGGTRDVDMESVESPRGMQEEYDPDDLSIDMPRQAVEFSGKDSDEDRARSWLGKAKSAFVRDQAPDSEKCLVFGDLLTGPARNWYRQLSRSTRSNWKELLGSFQTQYCGRGVSVARQYYHARKRSDESPLEYLHRLNVAGMRAKLQIKDGPGATRREHVEHFIETLDDRELADQLALLRLADAEVLEETLRARQRAKARQGKAHAGSNKFRQKYAEGSSESESESSGSEPEDEYRQVYLAASTDRGQRGDLRSPHQGDNRPTERPSTSMTQSRCTHCGSSKHDDLGCWKRLTCQKCGRKGHPSDYCLFVCRACGEIHDAGKCPMEEFYNLIRKWYVPTKHAGMLPVDAEKMLN